MPSVLGLPEQREARAQEELGSWLVVLSQAQEEVAAATERARVAREKVVQAPRRAGRCGHCAGRGRIGASRVELGHGERPPQWPPRTRCPVPS
ncbi:hypothetical protein AQJ27_48180 [Streptomyces olivochromogenes]|uniref:Uncharacterized protein n=1 Tax=Streptomyces olivochromogenes TaxID=1963 RepID=A0A250VV00_STROL|nr:hypothetical protein AQJ27_48180 [Streptomyces olivochromogenes]GAX57935.1 hypothetical protein SO3561_09506 [Streptomyces olivochromogenes]